MGRYGAPSAMNTQAFHPTTQPPDMVDFVDFKWLMASMGHRVDVPRLRCDAAYAQLCLSLALASPSLLLQQLASRLLSPPLA